MIVKIQSWLDDSVLWSGEAADLRDAVVQAVVSGADLTGAYLMGANLMGANLTVADLTGADLTGADLTGADLMGANLMGAYLMGADLTGADLTRAYLMGANLMGADLTGADLTGADLTPIRNDLWAVLDTVPAEVAGLFAVLKAGQVDGLTYTGACACLLGSIGHVRGCNYDAIPGLLPDSGRPAERWFLALRPGDAPETSVIARITAEWIAEWQAARTA